MLYGLKYDVLSLKSVGLRIRCPLDFDGIGDKTGAHSFYFQFVSCYLCWFGGYHHGLIVLVLSQYFLFCLTYNADRLSITKGNADRLSITKGKNKVSVFISFMFVYHFAYVISSINSTQSSAWCCHYF